MGFSVTYNILFEVQLLHHYILNNGTKVYDTMTDDEKALAMLNFDIQEVLEIVPTSECQKTLTAYRCVFKNTSTGFIVGLRAEPDNSVPPKYKPFIALSDDLKFSFMIRVRDMNFMNFTALPLTGTSGKIYSFQNITGTTKKKFPSLSAIAPLFKSGSEYIPGDMLVDNAVNPTQLFTAQVKTKNNTSVTTDWLTEKSADKLPVHYANINDLYSLARGFYFYTVKTKDVEPQATVKLANGVIVSPDVKVITNDFRVLQIDLRDYPEGFYNVHIESADHTYVDDISFYLLKQKDSPFAIIDLFVKSDDANYSMLDVQGFLRSPVYELRFRNRATNWRYIGKKFNATSVTDTPLPLTKFGVLPVKVKDKNGNDVDDLPNPSGSGMKTEALTSVPETKFYSEIFIH